VYSQGVVIPTEEAKAQYEKAIEEKQPAFLVESNKPDIFKVNFHMSHEGERGHVLSGNLLLLQ